MAVLPSVTIRKSVFKSTSYIETYGALRGGQIAIFGQQVNVTIVDSVFDPIRLFVRSKTDVGFDVVGGAIFLENKYDVTLPSRPALMRVLLQRTVFANIRLETKAEQAGYILSGSGGDASGGAVATNGMVGLVVDNCQFNDVSIRGGSGGLLGGDVRFLDV